MKIPLVLATAVLVWPHCLPAALAQDARGETRGTFGPKSTATPGTPLSGGTTGLPSSETGLSPEVDRSDDPSSSPLALQLKRRTEQDRAREAERRGIVLPYSIMLSRLQKFAPGDVVTVRLWERREDRWVYEFRVLSSAGRFLDVSLDARTARLLSRYER